MNPPKPQFPPGSVESVAGADEIGRLAIFHSYIWVLVIAFGVTIIATPLLRRLAIANGIIDHPSDPRKVHRLPVAYLGGVAVFLGIMGGIFFSYIATALGPLARVFPTDFLYEGEFHAPVPISILLGLTVIMFVGLLDDIVGVRPGVKVDGQLVAAAALALDDVGVNVARGVLMPVARALHAPLLTLDGVETLGFIIPLGPVDIPVDIIYWSGAAVIAIFVLGACNAANLIDGLDGLLTGTTAITTAGLLIVALTLAVLQQEVDGQSVLADGPRDGQRIVLCMAVLGACLGFLPHNFNPATIFLGDSGSLLLGFATIVIILTLGDTGKTALVLAGLIMFAVPIIDTVLAIVRRALAKKSISEADDQHLHHMLQRALGVKGAVLALYAITGAFTALGVALSLSRARVVYALALIIACYIAVSAIKIARRQQLEASVANIRARPRKSAKPVKSAKDAGEAA
ncbi:MAG: glycosyltransferase family 4 protein [Phycisphaerales bacterium JB039]